MKIVIINNKVLTIWGGMAETAQAIPSKAVPKTCVTSVILEDKSGKAEVIIWLIGQHINCIIVASKLIIILNKALNTINHPNYRLNESR